MKVALRDRLVCGLINSTCQKKLLTEKELSFEKALQLALAFEMANKQAQELQPRTHQEVKRVTASKPKHGFTAKKKPAATTTSHPGGGPKSVQNQGSWKCY